MERSKSGAKQKAIGVLDGVLTVSLVIIIFGCVICPKVFLQTSLKDLHLNETEDGSEQERFETYNSIHTTFKKQLNFADYAILTIATAFGLISTLAAVTLFMSPNPRNSPERKLQMTRFWMHCNLFTITMVMFEFFAVIVALDHSARVLIPLLVYIIFRVVVTLVIWNLLSIMSPTLIATFDPDVVEEKRARLKQVGKMVYYQRRMQPECRATIQGSVLPLRPYRGDGISVPSCQCTAPGKD